MLRETIRCRGKTCGPLPVWPQLPLYRQAQIMSRQGIDLDRSTLADWVGEQRSNCAPSSMH
ncbi:transposase [Rhizobium ruizarguesonis]|uniref:IS66 family transposase n=1 Tax=Rhizobium ruizarguesonis TaxID=2081791 RepID=UPI0037CAA1CB